MEEERSLRHSGLSKVVDVHVDLSHVVEKVRTNDQYRVHFMHMSLANKKQRLKLTKGNHRLSQQALQADSSMVKLVRDLQHEASVNASITVDYIRSVEKTWKRADVSKTQSNNYSRSLSLFFPYILC